MTTQPPDRLFRPVSPAAQAKGERVFCAAVALLLVLSEVFSSNIQNTLPTFSHVCRIALTVTAAVLLVAKSLLLTQWQTKQQALTAAALAAFAVFTTAYGHDQWFLFAVLLGIGAKDVDLRRVLQVYLAAAAGGLLAVQLLHAATPLVPYLYYCRNWDYGYGHYNGYGARLAGVFFAWGWLRWPRLRWWDWGGLAALAAALRASHNIGVVSLGSTNFSFARRASMDFASAAPSAAARNRMPDHTAAAWFGCRSGETPWAVAAELAFASAIC